jgi:hypothetical protein
LDIRYRTQQDDVSPPARRNNPRLRTGPNSADELRLDFSIDR